MTVVGLRPPREPLDPRTKRWWWAQIVLAAAVPVLTLTLLGTLITPARTWLWSSVLGLVLLAAVAVAGVPFRWRVHRWEATETAVYTRSGWLWQEWRAAPLSRVQTVDTTRGPVQRLFGLSSLIVTTASAKGAVVVAGLDHQIAEDLAERLTGTAGATPGDAT